ACSWPGLAMCCAGIFTGCRLGPAWVADLRAGAFSFARFAACTAPRWIARWREAVAFAAAAGFRAAGAVALPRAGPCLAGALRAPFFVAIATASMSPGPTLARRAWSRRGRGAARSARLARGGLARGLARGGLLGRLPGGLGGLGGLLRRRALGAAAGLLRRRPPLAADALLQQGHEVDHVGGGVGRHVLVVLLRLGDHALGLHALADHLFQARAELVLVAGGVPVAAHRLDQLARHVALLGADPVVTGGALGQAVLGRVHQLLRVAQQHQHQGVALRQHRGQVLAGADDHLRDPDLAGVAQGLPQEHVPLLGLLARDQDVGLLVIGGRDGGGIDERLHLDRLVALGRGGADVLLLQHHIAALVVLEGLDDVLPGHFLAGLGVDALVAHRAVVA